MTLKRYFFFWIMVPLDILADLVSNITPAREADMSTFAFNAPGKNSQKGPLGFHQLQWCDKHFGAFQGFAVMRKQAEASKSAPAVVKVI